MIEERIAVVVDGSLPSDSTFAHKVVPFYVICYPVDSGEMTSIRQDEISTADFLRIQEESRKLPTTSQPSINDFLKAFEELAEKGFTHLLVLTVPQSKSGTYNSARLALIQFKELHGEDSLTAELIDTGTTAGGIEYLSREAMRLVSQGESFHNIALLIEAWSKKIELFLALDKIDYISASGRIGELSERSLRETLKSKARNLAAWLARRTGHSPKVVLSFKHGEEKILTFSRFFHDMVRVLGSQVEKRVAEGERIKKIYLYNGNADDNVRILRDRLESIVPGVEIEEIKTLPMALLSITGPKYAAIICVYY